MIKVECPHISARARRLLAQRAVRRADWEHTFQPRVLPSGNHNSDFEIKETLRRGFLRKCGYCENIEANTIDHFWPRHPAPADAERYPDIYRTWDWDNFVLACSNCQNAKRERLPISDTGHQMINPREEEPVFFLRIEPHTGQINAIPIGGQVEKRGTYTLEILQFNRRDDLARGRAIVYKRVMNRIVDIVTPHTPRMEIDRKWEELRVELDPQRSFLAIVVQLFTFPSDEEALLIQALYEIVPESYEYVAQFRRLLPPYPQ